LTLINRGIIAQYVNDLYLIGNGNMTMITNTVTPPIASWRRRCNVSDGERFDEEAREEALYDVAIANKRLREENDRLRELLSEAHGALAHYQYTIGTPYADLIDRIDKELKSE
jgi:hypothetical protein